MPNNLRVSVTCPHEQVDTLETGEIDYENLRTHLMANKHKPAVLNLNIGTTVRALGRDGDTRRTRKGKGRGLRVRRTGWKVEEGGRKEAQIWIAAAADFRCFEVGCAPGDRPPGPRCRATGPARASACVSFRRGLSLTIYLSLSCPLRVVLPAGEGRCGRPR